MQTPTCGRIVHYFPNGNDPDASFNNADKVPAIIVQAFGERLNLYLFPMNPNLETPTLRWSTPHKSIANPGYPYWDWPEVPRTEGKLMESRPAIDPGLVRMSTTDGTSGDLNYKSFSESNGNQHRA